MPDYIHNHTYITTCILLVYPLYPFSPALATTVGMEADLDRELRVSNLPQPLPSRKIGCWHR